MPDDRYNRIAILDNEFFGEAIAKSHHHAAFDLSLQAKRIDRHAYIIGRDDLQHAHFAGQFVDFHFRGLYAKGEGKVHITARTKRLGLRRFVHHSGHVAVAPGQSFPCRFPRRSMNVH